MKVDELIEGTQAAIEKEYHCQDQCPLCGSSEYILEDFGTSVEPDGKDGYFDTIDFMVTCEGCGAQYTQRFKIGDYVKTIDLIPPDPED